VTPATPQAQGAVHELRPGSLWQADGLRRLIVDGRFKPCRWNFPDPRSAFPLTRWHDWLGRPPLT